MRKYLKYIVPIVCVLVVIVTFYMIFDIKSKVDEQYYNTDNIVVDENEVEDENVVEVENTVEDENVVEENTLPQDTNTVENTLSKEEVSEEEDSYSTKKLDEAKALVKKAWGDDDTVYFTNEGLNSEGLYMVAARDKTSTAVKNYFKVNLDTKKVQVDY